MSRIDKMSLKDIVDETIVYLTPECTELIWKANTPKEIVIDGRKLIGKIENQEQLDNFIKKYGIYVENTQFVVALILSYQELLKKPFISLKDKQLYQKAIEYAAKLLKDTDKILVFSDVDDKTNLIKSVTIISTKELVQGKSRKDRNDNDIRLKELEKDINFDHIGQSIMRSDIENTIVPNQSIAKALMKKIEYNSLAILLDSVEDRKKLEKLDVHSFAKAKGHSVFADEIIVTLKSNIEEVDFDKLLLCSARTYVDLCELEQVDQDTMPFVKALLEVINKHIKQRSTKVTNIMDKGTYTVKNLKQDLKRYIDNGDNVHFLTKVEIEKTTKELSEGKSLLTEMSDSTYDALNLSDVAISNILKINPNNYIYFLRRGDIICSKNRIFRYINDTRLCSKELLKLLCTKMNISHEDILELYDKEIISVGDMQAVREQEGQIITNEILISKYISYRDCKEQDKKQKAKMDLERYALAYRNTELIGKLDEEVESKGQDFITEVIDQIDLEDFVPLYSLGIIPLKVAVDWGGESIIEQLLESESLKPTDARQLRDNGLLDEKILERLFQKCTTMSYSYQISLVYSVFDKQTKEEEEIKERLAQYYNIENGISNLHDNISKPRKIRQTPKTGEIMENIPPVKRIKMRDPGAKYNLLNSFDKDVSIEEGIKDGHIIFHYPNIDGGTVLIEKLHKIKLNKQTGLIEISADNQSATYILSEEEFIRLKPSIIQEGKIDRTQLTNRWWVTRDKDHWIPHLGMKSWEMALKERFNINEQNERYTKQELEKIEELIQKSIESKKGEDR